MDCMVFLDWFIVLVDLLLDLCEDMVLIVVLGFIFLVVWDLGCFEFDEVLVVVIIEEIEFEILWL